MTDQVILRPVSAALAQRIVAHLPDDDDDEVWVADFPGEVDVMAATMFLLVSQVYGDLGPFGCYTIERERCVVLCVLSGFPAPRSGCCVTLGSSSTKGRAPWTVLTRNPLPADHALSMDVSGLFHACLSWVCAHYICVSIVIKKYPRKA